MTNFKNYSELFLLPSRLILFLIFQMLIAILLGSFDLSARFWIASATITNMIGIVWLVFLFKIEGKRFLDLFRMDMQTFKTDILLFSGLALACIPVIFLPDFLLAICLWNDPAVPYNLMFKPIPTEMVYLLAVLFPITIAFAELATYFGYIMPKLMQRFKKKWVAVGFPVFFLSVQHCTLPFIPDLKFVFYRGLVYFPFALLIGIALSKRPKLFPYFAILHGLLDFATVMVLLNS